MASCGAVWVRSKTVEVWRRRWCDAPAIPPVRTRAFQRSRSTSSPTCTVELSVLGPFERIEPAPDRFTIGVHGLMVEQGANRGVLLPQVATEWGWTPEQFLRQTCIKAGLPADAWQRDADVYRFSAEVFGD